VSKLLKYIASLL